mmetsp:Transcript_11733/g.17962  ORF Transcript_11733/g.17962 Transcript_11733/m.17962 type:complete len:96 (-) Transcript_11733:996-1283(-)
MESEILTSEADGSAAVEDEKPILERSEARVELLDQPITPPKKKNKLANLVKQFDPSPDCNLAPPSLQKLDKNPSNIAVANLDARSVADKFDNASI